MIPQTRRSRFVEMLKLLQKLRQTNIFFGSTDTEFDPKSFRHFEQDLRFLKRKFWRDVQVNISMVLAFVLNPFSAVQLLASLWRLDFSNFDNLSKFNKQVFKLYPLIIFDWLSLGLFVTLLTLNILMGNIRPCILVIRKFLTKGCDDARLAKLEKSDILFENIWICVFGFGMMIYKQTRNLLLYPIAVFSPKEFKEYRKFDEENWFHSEKYFMVSEYVFGVFWGLFNAKYKLLIRRLTKEEKGVKESLLKMVDAEIWDKDCLQQWIEAEEPSLAQVQQEVPQIANQAQQENPAPADPVNN